MKIPILSNLIDSQVKQRVSKLMGDYFTSDIVDKKYSWEEQNYAPETKQDFALAYEKHIWSFCAIHCIATNASQVPLLLYQKGSDQEVTSGPLWELINVPNPETSYNDFIESFFTYAELCGDSFIELNDATNPTMMKVLRSYWVDCNYNNRSKKYEYRYKPAGSPEITFQDGNILHFKYFNPNSDLYGMSAIQTVTQDIIIDKNSTRYMQEFFSKGGMINLYLKVKAGLQDFEFKRLKQETKENLTGLRNAHQIPVFDNDAELKSAGYDVDQILLKGTKDSCRDEILAAFGVPPIMLGFLSGIETYNNSEIQKKSFWEVTMKPKLSKSESFFNRTLFWKYGYEVKYDLSVVQALKDDESKQATTLSTLKGAGIITVNEARAEIGYEPIPGGDVLQAQTATPVTMIQQSEPLKKNLATAITVELIKAAKTTAQKEYDYSVKKYEETLVPFFKDWEQEILNTINSVEKLDIKKDLLTAALSTLDTRTKRLMKDLAEVSDEVAQELSQSNYDRQRGGTMPKDVKNNVQRTMRKHIVKWSENSAESITKTMREKLSTAIDKYRADIPQLTKRVEEIFQGTNMDYSHARMIARTESATITNTTRLEVAKENGFTKKTWIAVTDSHSRDWHDGEMNGTTVPIDQPFTVGNIQMQYPGDPIGGPHNNCNCRCTLIEN